MTQVIREVAYGVTVKTRAPGLDQPGLPPQYLSQGGVWPVYLGETLEQARTRIASQLDVPAGRVVLKRWDR